MLGPGAAGGGLRGTAPSCCNTCYAALPAAGSVLFTVIYTLNVGLFVLLLARTNYAWRALVLFRPADAPAAAMGMV